MACWRPLHVAQKCRPEHGGLKARRLPPQPLAELVRMNRPRGWPCPQVPYQERHVLFRLAPFPTRNSRAGIRRHLCSLPEAAR